MYSQAGPGTRLNLRAAGTKGFYLPVLPVDCASAAQERCGFRWRLHPFCDFIVKRISGCLTTDFNVTNGSRSTALSYESHSTTSMFLPERSSLRVFSELWALLPTALPMFDSPGIYMRANIQEQPPHSKPSISSQLVYIGETCGQSLHDRLYQFNRSGFLDKFGHSGGATFARTFKPKPEPACLFVSVMGVDLVEPACSAFIRYAGKFCLT